MQAKSTLAFEARKRKRFGLIRLHIEDETIRDDIDANPPGDGPAAWLIVIAAGTAQQTALFDDTQDIEWNAATLFLVGISETTIRDLKVCCFALTGNDLQQSRSQTLRFFASYSIRLLSRVASESFAKVSFKPRPGYMLLVPSMVSQVSRLQSKS